MKNILQILKVRDVKTPERANDSDSGIDFFIPNDLKMTDLAPRFTPMKSEHTGRKMKDKKFKVLPGEGILIPSGIHTVIQKGYDLVFDNKSGVAVKYGLIVGAKVVDSSYRGEIHLHLINSGYDPIELELGQKVVQGVVRKVELCQPIEMSQEQFINESNTERGEGGFGSTGEK